MTRPNLAEPSLYRRAWRTLVRARNRVQAIWARLRGRPVIHFMHVGKTGGTALKAVLKRANRQGHVTFILHPHYVGSEAAGPKDRILVVLRDPISRFRSAFYSRKRKGQPRRFSEWSRLEAPAFARFDHANDLAEALSSPDAETRAAAGIAMLAIEHVRSSYLDWLTVEDVTHHRDRVVALDQTALAAEFSAFTASLGLPEDLKLPQDDTSAHRNSYDDVPALSDTARANLRAWYARDYALLEALKNG